MTLLYVNVISHLCNTVRIAVQDFSSEQPNGKSTLPPLGQMRIAHKQRHTPVQSWTAYPKYMFFPQIALADEVTQQFCRCLKEKDNLEDNLSRDLNLLWAIVQYFMTFSVVIPVSITDTHWT